MFEFILRCLFFDGKLWYLGRSVHSFRSLLKLLRRNVRLLGSFLRRKIRDVNKSIFLYCLREAIETLNRSQLGFFFHLRRCVRVLLTAIPVQHSCVCCRGQYCLDSVDDQYYECVSSPLENSRSFHKSQYLFCITSNPVSKHLECFYGHSLFSLH